MNTYYLFTYIFCEIYFKIIYSFYPVSKTNPMDDIMQLIRTGVKLRSVNTDGEMTRSKTLVSPSDSHTQQLQELLTRINKRTQVSSDEDSDSDHEFDD